MEHLVKRTHRLAPYLFVCTTLAIVGVLYEETFIGYAMVLACVAILMRQYSSLSVAAVSRLAVEVRTDATTEVRDVLVKFKLRNTTMVPVLLGEYSLFYPPLLKIKTPSRTGLVIIPPRGVCELSFTFGGRAGTYRVGPLKMVVRDPLGLYRSDEIEVHGVTEVKVLPSIEWVAVKKLWVFTRKSGLVKARQAGEGVELYDIREYNPGDELRHVVWRLYASRGVLAVKEMERESYQHVVFLVDSTRDAWVGPPRQTPVEHFSRIVASVAYYLCLKGYSVSVLVFNERKISSSGKPARGSEGFRRLYRVLSDIEYVEDGAEPSTLGIVSDRVLTLVPRERTLVFLFTRPSGGGREDQLFRISDSLKSRGHEFFLVTPVVLSYDTSDMPPLAQKLYQLKLYEVLRDDLTSLAKLRARGIKVVAIDPTYVPQRVVRIVEELL